MIDGEDEKTKDLRKDKWRQLERKKIKQTKDWGEDTFWGWKKMTKWYRWNKRFTRFTSSGEWGHPSREKKTITKKRLWWVRTHFWDERNC